MQKRKPLVLQLPRAAGKRQAAAGEELNNLTSSPAATTNYHNKFSGQRIQENHHHRPQYTNKRGRTRNTNGFQHLHHDVGANESLQHDVSVNGIPQRENKQQNPRQHIVAGTQGNILSTSLPIEKTRTDVNPFKTCSSHVSQLILLPLIVGERTLSCLLDLGASQNFIRPGIAHCTQSYQGKTNAATGVTPARALLGYELPRPAEHLISADHRYREEERAEILENIRERQLQYIRRYDNQNGPAQFTRGQQVVIRNHPISDSENPAGFAPKWLGPFTINECFRGRVYLINKDGRTVRVHADDLRPAPSSNDSDKNHRG